MSAVQNKFANLPKVAKLAPGREWTYFLRADCEEKLVKIGHSVNLKWRLSGLQTQCPVQLSLVALVEAPAGAEFVFHEALRDSRAHGEWFRPTEDLERIRKALPKGGSIETPELSELVASLGIESRKVLEILVAAAYAGKHLCEEEEPTSRHMRDKAIRFTDYTSPRFRRMLRELSGKTAD